MQSIVPPGYADPEKHKRLAELRKIRATELAGASETDRARIEKEIAAEAERQRAPRGLFKRLFGFMIH